ncbi:MAG: tRNA 2-thiocytidine(32) synthetase TtcA [Clostridia bacterium]|nr:tRNA 2-thiocytidine(32) synthetase TtcA [Clostridia bacterium]
MNLQKLMSKARKAIDDYNMIEEGDKIAVGLSGGKDSMTLLAVLSGLKKFYPKSFDLVAITVDMGLGLDQKEVDAVSEFCRKNDVPFAIEKTAIGEIVFDLKKEKNPCSLCANMRRGALNSAAKREGCNKVALGHHADDLIETFFLSAFYESRISTFSPITYLEKADIAIIRPMIYLREKDIAGFSKNNPIIHNPCPADKHTNRQFVKDKLKEMEKHIPDLRKNVLSAIIHPERANLFGVNNKQDEKKEGLYVD